MHLKEKSEKILISMANKTLLKDKNSRNNNINVNNPKSRNITSNMFKYTSEANNYSKNIYEKYNKKKINNEPENIGKNTLDVRLKEKILKNFFLNSDKNSSSKNKISSNKTRNKQKNLQLYLTYSNKSEIQNKNMRDSNAIKNQNYNINTVKINLNKVQSKNEKINIYMSYDMSKKSIEKEREMKPSKFSQSLFKKKKTRSSSSRKDYTEENWIKTNFNKKESDSLGRDNSSKHYSKLDSLSKKKPYLFFSDLKTKVFSRNIRPINPTITLENNLNKNTSLAKICKAISNKNSEITSTKNLNILESSFYLDTTANKTQNKSSQIKKIHSEKSKVKFDSNFFKKSNSDQLNLKKNNAKNFNIKNYDGLKINLNKANNSHIYNYKNDLNAFLAKSKNYSKDKSAYKYSDSYFRVNSTSLGNCNVSSEHSLINLGEKNPRKRSNVSKNETPVNNLKKNSDDANYTINNNNPNTINSLKLGGGGRKENKTNKVNYVKFNVAPTSMPSKKDGSVSKNTITNKPNHYFIEDAKRKIINASSGKKTSHKINFSNQNFDYKNIKGDLNFIKKKTPNSNFKIFSQNIIDREILKRETNLKLSEYNMHNENEINQPRNHLQKEGNSSNFSNLKNKHSSFSTIKNVKFNLNNSSECTNNQLNSENSYGICNSSVPQTNSNVSSNNPYLETKYTNHANNSNCANLLINQNVKCNNADNTFTNKTSSYKNYNILNLSPKKGIRVKLLDDNKKRQNFLNDINSVIINEDKTRLADKRSNDSYLNNAIIKRNYVISNGLVRNINL